MSFDDILSDEKDKKKEKKVTDPKLLRYMAHPLKSAGRPDIVLISRKEHTPNRSVSIIMDGKPVQIQGEVLERYKCNKCELEFNHPHNKIVAGVLPKCPQCD